MALSLEISIKKAMEELTTEKQSFKNLANQKHKHLKKQAIPKNTKKHLK